MEIFLHTPSLIIGSIGTQLLFLAALGAPAGELEAVRG